MQTLANYLLVAENADSARVTGIRTSSFNVIDSWLREKGVADPSVESGTFASLTPGATGTYERRLSSGEGATLTQIRLEEPARTGQTFLTMVTVVAAATKISIYVRLTVRNSEAVIAPVVTDPKCPWVVRRLFEVTDLWTFGGRELPLPLPRAMNGETGGTALADLILSPNRNIPLLVVSEIEGQAVWPRIANDLAVDLTALAAVVTVDEDGAWALTNKLGRAQSCFNAGIRLYWPVREETSGAYTHGRLWTASTLLSNDRDGRGALRLRTTVRRMVMAVAALTIEPPPEIDTILSYAARQRLRELEARDASHSEELEIARLFLSDNEQLRNELAETKRELAHWSSRAEAAEYALDQRSDAVDALEGADDNAEPSPPMAGEIRFYKKLGSTPNHDVFVQVTSCGHSAWQASNKAEKAKKGLRKLLGDEDWKALHHCGTCTGGGMWRVRW
ncbi:MAG TPA: hypothetical protein VF618_13005 [Thermoanaerobaculia bacterium]